MSNQFISLINEITSESLKEFEDSVGIDKIVSDKNLFDKYISLVQTKTLSKIETEAFDKDILKKQAEEFLVKNNDNPIIHDINMKYTQKKSPIKPPQKTPSNIQNESIDELSILKKQEDIKNLFKDIEQLNKYINSFTKINDENTSDTYKTLIKDIQKERLDDLSKSYKPEDIENLFKNKETFTKHITTLTKKMNEKIDANNLDRETLLKDFKNIVNNNLKHPILVNFYKKINIELEKQQAENAKAENIAAKNTTT